MNHIHNKFHLIYKTESLAGSSADLFIHPAEKITDFKNQILR